MPTRFGFLSRCLWHSLGQENNAKSPWTVTKGLRPVSFWLTSCCVTVSRHYRSPPCLPVREWLFALRTAIRPWERYEITHTLSSVGSGVVQSSALLTAALRETSQALRSVLAC